MNAVYSNSVNTEEAAVALSEGRHKLQKVIIGPLKFLLSSISRSIIKFFTPQSYIAQRKLIFFLLALAIAIFPHVIRAADLMASQKPDANDTFGHGSTVEWILYLAEIIVSVVGFIKTRNPMVFSGLIILILITRAFFSLIS